MKGYEEGFLLGLPGNHNISNALACIIVGHILKHDFQHVKDAGLKSFKGIKRRFEIIADDPIVYIDDYAHHPSEIAAVYQAVRSIYPKKNICVVFQPHLFSRTKDFALEFAKSLDLFDQIILMNIYPAREQPVEGVDAYLIKELMKNEFVDVVEDDKIIDEFIKLNEIDVLMTLGAGDIDRLVPKNKEFNK